MNRLVAVPIIVIGLLLSVGCSPPGVEEAQVDFCQALDNYRDSVAQLQDINEQTTIDELNGIRDSVVESRENLLDSATTLREARLRYTESAWEALQKEFENIPGEATLGETAPSVRGQVAVLLTEIDRMNNVSCERR